MCTSQTTSETKRTDSIYSESHRVVSFVAPFTVTLDSGKSGIALKYVFVIIQMMVT